MFEAVVGASPGTVMPALADLDAGPMSDTALIDAIVAAERLASFATACQAELIAELATRRMAGDPSGGEFVADEIGAALQLSRVAANRRLGFALDLARLPATAQALRVGVIDLSRARALAEATACLPDELGREIEAQVLPRAPEQTAAQLRNSLNRAVLAANPAAAELRHQQQLATRRVELHPQPDGMAELWALLPADQAVAVYTALDRYARGAGKNRRIGIDARRADALVALVTGAACSADGAEAGRARPPRALVQVTVPATTLLGVRDEPGELAGYGPIPADLARMLAAGGIWRRLLTDARSGALLELGRTTYVPPAALADHVRARDLTCRFPGCRRPAVSCDLDHTRRYPDGPTCPCNLAALCRHHHRLKHQTNWTVSQDEHGVLTWISPTGHMYRTHPPPRGHPAQPEPTPPVRPEEPTPAEQPAPPDGRAPAKQAMSEQPADPQQVVSTQPAHPQQVMSTQPAHPQQSALAEQPATDQPTRANHETAA